jgi:hypothetical protein
MAKGGKGMKKTILIILLASMVLGSCVIMPEADVPEFSSLDQAWYWIRENITYTLDMEAHGKEDYWQYPEETARFRTGDCEDICFLFQDIALKQFGIDVQAAWVEWDTEGGRIGHMHPKINGKYYMDSFSWKKGFSEEFTLDYSLVLTIIRLNR